MCYKALIGSHLECFAQLLLRCFIFVQIGFKSIRYEATSTALSVTSASKDQGKIES